MDLEAYGAMLQANIDRVGYTFVGVFDPEGDDPTFAYSIGLTKLGWPEVLFIGNLNPVYIEVLLTDLVEGWRKAGKVILGDNPDLIAFPDGSSHAMRVVDIPDTRTVVDKYACQVPHFCPNLEMRFVQVMWPDKAGLFPNDVGYNTKMVQPYLGRF